MEIRVVYLDDLEATAEFWHKDEKVLEVYLRPVDERRREASPELKPFDLSITIEKDMYNVIDMPKEG